MRKLIVFLMVVLAVSLAACGGQATTGGGGGDAAAGKLVFNQGASPPCASCHSVEAGVTLVGPSLAGIASEFTTADAMRQAVVEPNAEIAEGFAANIMPTTYGSQLSDQQLSDLVAYLLTLK